MSEVKVSEVNRRLDGEMGRLLVERDLLIRELESASRTINILKDRLEKAEYQNRGSSEDDTSKHVRVRWKLDPIAEMMTLLVKLGKNKAIRLEIPEEGFYQAETPTAVFPVHFIRGAMGGDSQENDALSQAIELMREATYLLDAAECPEVRQAIHDLIQDLRNSMKVDPRKRFELAVAMTHGGWSAGHFFIAETEAEAHEEFEKVLHAENMEYAQIWTHSIYELEEFEEGEENDLG